MCDQDDLGGFDQAARQLNRREFGRMALGAGLLATLPSRVFAGHTRGEAVNIKTDDGVADAWFVHPVEGRHPAVLIWPDIFGLRPAFIDMATRLAESGYAVLVVNPFYRQQRAPTAPKNASFDDPATREKLMALRGSLTPETAAIDAKSFVAFLDRQPSVNTQRRIGTSGYCMGGPLVMRTAAAVPGRIGAGASFHGGGLATDKPDSPHLLIQVMEAQFLIAVAENDDAKDPKAKETLAAAFKTVNLPAEIEVYAGTRHGWCPTDSPVYDHAQAEKAWSRMLGLFERALKA